MAEELASVAGVDHQQGEGQAAQDAGEGVPHDQGAAAQDGHPLTPSGGDIHQLEGVNVQAVGRWAGMVNQVRFDVPGLGRAAGDPTGGDVAEEGVGLRCLPPGKAGLIVTERPHHAGDGGDADAA